VDKKLRGLSASSRPSSQLNEYAAGYVGIAISCGDYVQISAKYRSEDSTPLDQTILVSEKLDNPVAVVN
jgi:hypothetical protein